MVLLSAGALMLGGCQTIDGWCSPDATPVVSLDAPAAENSSSLAERAGALLFEGRGKTSEHDIDFKP